MWHQSKFFTPLECDLLKALSNVCPSCCLERTEALDLFMHRSCPCIDLYNLKPDVQLIQIPLLLLLLFSLPFSPCLRISCMSLSQAVSGHGPLRLRPPPQLSKAETRHRRRQCGHDILATIVGFRQPAFKHITKERTRNKSRREETDSFQFHPCVWEA